MIEETFSRGLGAFHGEVSRDSRWVTSDDLNIGKGILFLKDTSMLPNRWERGKGSTLRAYLLDVFFDPSSHSFLTYFVKAIHLLCFCYWLYYLFPASPFCEDMAFDDPEWVRRVKQGGAVPLMDVSSCFNGWSSPPGHYFQVRGEEYLRSKAKVAGGEWLLKPLAFDWVKSSTSKISYIMSHPNCRVRGALEALGRADPRGKPFIWVFNLQVPSKDNHSLVFYFLSYKNDSAMKERLVDRFLHADAEFRDSRLKLVANVEKGPWIVKKAVGEQAVCILGKAVSCEYFQGEDFMEIDVDIGGSVIANAVVNLAFGYVTSLSVDLAFVIEGRTESELPEKILGAIRFSNLDPELAISMEEAVIKHDKLDGLIGVHELETRFWRSLLHVESEEADDHHLQRRILSVADC